MRQMLVATVGAALLIAAGCSPPPAPEPELCAPGTFSTTGAEPCEPAPAGTFVDTEGATEATLCPLGTFQDETGQTSCEPAPIGTYVDVVGASGPIDCPPGTTTEFAGATSVDDCVESLLAVAYSNLDGIDGYDPSGSDVLIAKLIDTNLDGSVSAGDTIETNQYPLDLDATGFGTFQTTTHTVSTILQASSTTAQVFDAANNVYQFSKFPAAQPGGLDVYQEDTATGTRTKILDQFTEFGEQLFVLQPGPSDPDTFVDFQTEPRATDDAFIDVDLLY